MSSTDTSTPRLRPRQDKVVVKTTIRRNSNSNLVKFMNNIKKETEYLMNLYTTN